MHTAMQFLYAPHCGQRSRPQAAEIEAAVDTALLQRHAARRLLPAGLEAERARLIRVLQEWLAFESGRGGFRVMAVEKELDAHLRGNEVRLRVDRIDRMENGDRMIIDYKSSAAKTSGWAYDRLRQAQLPLYAVLLSREEGASGGPASEPMDRSRIGGATLAVVRGGECAFDGIAGDSQNAFAGIRDITGRKTLLGRSFEDWDGLMRHWAACIDGLAVEVEQGDCPNLVYNPENPSLAGMDILLRHSEATAWLTANEELQAGKAP